jgi:hypothetical protein
MAAKFHGAIPTVSIFGDVGYHLAQQTFYILASELNGTNKANWLLPAITTA